MYLWGWDNTNVAAILTNLNYMCWILHKVRFQRTVWSSVVVPAYSSTCNFGTLSRTWTFFRGWLSSGNVAIFGALSSWHIWPAVSYAAYIRSLQTPGNCNPLIGRLTPDDMIRWGHCERLTIFIGPDFDRTGLETRRMEKNPTCQQEKEKSHTRMWDNVSQTVHTNMLVEHNFFGATKHNI